MTRPFPLVATLSLVFAACGVPEEETTSTQQSLSDPAARPADGDPAGSTDEAHGKCCTGYCYKLLIGSKNVTEHCDHWLKEKCSTIAGVDYSGAYWGSCTDKKVTWL